MAERIDELQEKMILVLRDALKGHVKGQAGYQYNEMDNHLPRPGLSMEAIAALCREVDKRLSGRASLRALHFFTGMPVDDLVEGLDRADSAPGSDALELSKFLDALPGIDTQKHSITEETTESGKRAFEGETTSFFAAFAEIAKRNRWKLPATSPAGLGGILAREAETLADLGWRRSLSRIRSGHRYWRYEETAATQ